MQIIQALIFVFAALFGNVDGAPVGTTAALQVHGGGSGEGIPWQCDLDPDAPGCDPIKY